MSNNFAIENHDLDLEVEDINIDSKELPLVGKASKDQWIPNWVSKWIIPSWLTLVWNLYSDPNPSKFELQNLKYKVNEQLSMKSKLVIVAWIAIGIATPFSLYLDYKCSNVVVPFDYIPIDASENYQPIMASTNVNVASGNGTYQCSVDADCNNGQCQAIKTIDGQIIGSQCVCNCDYASTDNGVCSYHRLAGLTALLLTILVGECGIDRCFLARGNGCHICIGIVKGFTCGGLGIWWIVDIALIASKMLHDGNGQIPSNFNC